MAGEAKIEVGAQLIPRHYVVALQATLDPTAMIELVQILSGLDVADDAAGGFFAVLRERAAEAYTGDLPQPIVVPDAPPSDDEPGGGVPAKPTA